MICQIVQNGGCIFLILFLCMITTNISQDQHTFTVQEYCNGNQLLHNIEPGTPYILNLRSDSLNSRGKWFHKSKRRCHKEIKTSDSAAHLEISITNINIPSCNDCRCSYFEISAFQHRKRFCGYSEDFFSSKSDAITIEFHPELNRPFNVTLIFTASRNFYILTGSSTKDASVPSGFIETPYYPNPYPPKYTAEYVLSCDTNSSVLLLFLDFQISPQSFIEVYGNNNTHPTRYFEQFRPPVLVSELNKPLNLKFEANDLVGRPGFRAEFSCIKSTDHLYVPITNCGGLFNRSRGLLNIKTQEKFALYDCVWHISFFSSPESYMSVLVVLKNISPKSKLVFRNGRNSKSPVVKEINCEEQNCSYVDQKIEVPHPADLYIRFHGYLDGLSVVNISYSTYHRGKCSNAEFRCNDDRCILSDFQCDGIKQCPDGSDESMCSSTENADNQLPFHPTADPEKLKIYDMQQKFIYIVIFGGFGLIMIVALIIVIGNYRKQIAAEQILPQSVSELSDVQPTIYPVNSYGCDNPPSYEDYIKSSDNYPPILFTRVNQKRSASDCTHCTTSFCTGARVRHSSADSFHGNNSKTSSDITLNIAEDASNFSQPSPNCNVCNIKINQSFTFDSSNSVRRSYSLDSKLGNLAKNGSCEIVNNFSVSITHPVHVPCSNQHVCHSLPTNFKITKTCDSKEPEINNFASMHLDSSKNFFKNRRFTQSLPLHRSIGSEIVTVVKTRCFSEPCSRISVECSMHQ